MLALNSILPLLLAWPLEAESSATPLPAAQSSRPEDVGIPITDPSYPIRYKGLGHEPGVSAAFDSPTLLFVNFDGANMRSGCGNDSHRDCSTIVSGRIAPYPGSDTAKSAIIQAVRADVKDFGVIVVGERPADNNPYAMVMVGAADNGLDPAIGGVAPWIDCGNTDPNMTSFAFHVDSGANTLATIIHQEAAHTWGLEHVDDPQDNLHPTTGLSNPTYRDVCSKIVSDTDLTPFGGECNQVHTRYCDSGYQNSYREMLLLFGPPVADTVAPTVTIDAPAAGESFAYEEDWHLVITLDDDRRPQVLTMSILFDDALVIDAQDYQNTTLDFTIQGGDAPGGHGLASGSHTLRVDITDEGGNPASAEVQIEIQPPLAGETDGESADTGTTTTDPISDGTGAGGGSENDSAQTASDSESSEASGTMLDGETSASCACAHANSRSFGLWYGGLAVLLALSRRRGRSSAHAA